MTKQVLRNRIENDFQYHAPKNGQTNRYEAIRAKSKELAEFLVDECPEGRELSTALTSVETAVMWANAAIARNE